MQTQIKMCRGTSEQIEVEDVRKATAMLLDIKREYGGKEPTHEK